MFLDTRIVLREKRNSNHDSWLAIFPRAKLFQLGKKNSAFVSGVTLPSFVRVTTELLGGNGRWLSE